MFDNILIGHSVDDAKKLAQATFALKKKAEPVPEQPASAVFSFFIIPSLIK